MKLFGSGGGSSNNTIEVLTPAQQEAIQDSSSKKVEEESKEEVIEEVETQETEEANKEETEEITNGEVIEIEEPICSVENANICTRSFDNHYMAFHRHLACAGVVAPEASCEDANCERVAIRKEVVAMSVKLGRHDLLSPDRYRYHYTDVDYEAGGWVPAVVETGLGLGVITGLKTEFRPEREVTRAESYAILMK